ncbi:DUF551 domain-containing protein [Escherichia coli]|uniref:DUF551 domain-containing protein n=1 Tax=Escherichia coli TaxID=562 RepID=UPI000E0237ED|nr:DUF551 domain-containing protein [Escherichia coli]EFL6449048.1 DUF551 domain-containing protein [Escherichia coli]STK94635.1 Valyl-tRNA synthetase [Escherichia coli]
MTAQLSRERLERVVKLKDVYDPELTKAMARILLEGMDSEPYGYVHQAIYEAEGCAGLSSDHEAHQDSSSHIPLYRHPPAQVAVPECFRNAVSALESLYRNGQKQCWNERYTTDMAYASGVLNACRAAMQAEPVSAAYKLPDGWIKCSERMPENMDTVITSNGIDRGQGWWDGDSWQSWNSYDSVPDEVTHWMPLPAAPEQEV